MGAFSTSSGNMSEDFCGSPNHPRRHTIHDVKMDYAAKREIKKLMRSNTPPQQQFSVEDIGIPKSSKEKKQMQIQRNKDRDEKKDFSNALSSIPNPLEVSRSLSEDISLPRRNSDVTASVITNASNSNHLAVNYSDPYPKDIAVAESLNPYSLCRRNSGGAFTRNSDPQLGRSSVRRTNSDAQFSLGLLEGATMERRCAPERKRFYRQFIKSIKLYGIKSIAASRLETPGPTHTPRFHSENLASANPFSPTIQKLWLELRSYLKDRSYEEWLFFNRHAVEKVLHRIVHFYFSMSGVNSSIGAVSVQLCRDGPLGENAHSTPLLHSLSEQGNGKGVRRRERWESEGEDTFGRFNKCETRPEASGRISNTGDGGGEDYVDCANIPSDSGAPQEQQQQDDHTSTYQKGPTLNLEESLEHCPCKVNHRYYLSSLQQKVLSEVNELLGELDEVETLYMNRKRMGDEHHTYRTLFFKRRVCALVLWQKVTYGLAENLCRLSNWLGTTITLPEVCRDPPSPPSHPASPSPSSPSSSTTAIYVPFHNPTLDSLQSPASVISTNTPLQVQTNGNGRTSSTSLRFPPPPPSPLSTSSHRPTSFHIGSPKECEGLADSLQSASGLTSRVPVTSSISSSTPSGTGTMYQRQLTHQGSVHDPYRDFVSGSLKRKGLDITTKVYNYSTCWAIAQFFFFLVSFLSFFLLQFCT